MSESPQEQPADPSNKGKGKDHHTNLILIPSTKHLNTSFAVNFKSDSNIMVERDKSIMCQQNSKEPEIKKKNNHNHRTNNFTENKEADKSNRQQYQNLTV